MLSSVADFLDHFAEPLDIGGNHRFEVDSHFFMMGFSNLSSSTCKRFRSWG
ncbi:MAG: hypothetical protein R3C26_19305 [Calditrichia bacterium]